MRTMRFWNKLLSETLNIGCQQDYNFHNNNLFKEIIAKK
jgi:hypothetical protein